MSRYEGSGSNSNNNNNSGTIAAPTTTQATKLCHIVKRPDFEGYGFNLHSEKVKPGQYVGKVDANSPAEVAGLKEGNRIIEVNGVNIGQETHKQVVQRIKAISNEVRLLLIDVDAAGQQRQQQLMEISTANNANSNTYDKDRNSKSSEGIDMSNISSPTSRGVVLEMSGASANISSISVISTKRTFNESDSNEMSMTLGEVATDGSSTAKAQQQHEHNTNSNLNSAVSNNNATSCDVSCDGSQIGDGISRNDAAKRISVNNGVAGGSGLQLSMTAAEMRAKLLSKKKHNPKNESVDLKKKFEIIQKL